MDLGGWDRMTATIYVRKEPSTGKWLVGCTGCWSLGRASRWDTAHAAACLHARHHAAAQS